MTTSCSAVRTLEQVGALIAIVNRQRDLPIHVMRVPSWDTPVSRFAHVTAAGTVLEEHE
jgi:hypothetical protein